MQAHSLQLQMPTVGSHLPGVFSEVPISRIPRQVCGVVHCSLLDYALSSPHVERVLSTLREVCLSPTVKFSDYRSVLSNITLEVDAIRSSVTSSAESNVALLDFICSPTVREVTSS